MHHTVFICTTIRVSLAANTSQRQWIEKVQKRLSTTSHFLDNIKAVKMQNLSRAMAKVVEELRADEIATSKVYRKLLIIILLLCESCCNCWRSVRSLR